IALLKGAFLWFIPYFDTPNPFRLIVDIMKTLIISFSLSLASIVAFAQVSNDTIVLATGSSGLYFYHIVQKGETLENISEKFNTSEKRLIALNDTKKPETYDVIKVPINKSSIVQSGNASAHKALKPLYHKVLKGETLYRIGKMYGDIPLSSIRSWNNLKGNNIGIGEYLIIGWLRNNPDNSRHSQDISSSPVPDTTPAETDSADKNIPSSQNDGFLKEVISS